MPRQASRLCGFAPSGDYLQRILPEGSVRLVSGKVELFDHQAQMVHPDYVLEAP